MSALMTDSDVIVAATMSFHGTFRAGRFQRTGKTLKGHAIRFTPLDMHPRVSKRGGRHTLNRMRRRNS